MHTTRDLSTAEGYPEDAEMASILSSVHEQVTSVSAHALLRTASPLDGRSSIIRNFETNLGNFLADAVRAFYNTEIAFVNSGSVRCDRIVPEGELTVRDIIGTLQLHERWHLVTLTEFSLTRYSTLRQPLHCEANIRTHDHTSARKLGI